MKKYKIPVVIETDASCVIGEVECDSYQEFLEKREALWKSQEYDVPTANASNDFDLGSEWDFAEFKEEYLRWYLNNKP